MNAPKKTLIENKQKIVVLDDDINILKFFNQIFDVAFPNCNVKYFDKITSEFNDRIFKNGIDLFIMDIVLHGKKDGIEISEEIISKKKGSVFLFMSGYDYTENSFEHFKGKCVYDFLKKPTKKNDLILIVSTLLNVAATYKESCKIQPQKIEPTMNNLRSHYMKLIEEDKLLIERLQNAANI